MDDLQRTHLGWTLLRLFVNVTCPSLAGRMAALRGRL